MCKYFLSMIIEVTWSILTHEMQLSFLFLMIMKQLLFLKLLKIDWYFLILENAMIPLFHSYLFFQSLLNHINLALLSIIWQFGTLNMPLLSGWTDSNKIWKIVCDLLLFVFMEVCLIKRFFSPLFINYKQSR